MRFSSILLLLVVSFSAKAQNTGIRGHVNGENNEPLPFATVYIRNLNTGTTTNIEGDYEIQLAPGKYDVVFQYIGYESVVHFFEVAEGFVTYNLSLKPRTILLKEIEIRSGAEDPAYSIMRKAIGKASFHTNQLDAYDARVYIKGSGRLLDSPFFLRKKIAEEGIDSTMAFTSESVSELRYERPNTYSQKVVAVYSQGEDNGTGPGQFITSSFYDPKVVEAISPLSPKAFAYYRFRYDGYFVDGGHVINKITVTPRSRGDDVFEGTIFIVDELWSIHSLDLKMYKLGIEFKLEQLYNPIEEKAWLPVSYQFEIMGSFFGFDFEYKYLATLSDYKITLNPDLDIPITVIDEKAEREKAAEVRKKTKGEETLEKLADNKEVTRKDLRKLMKEYEKAEMEEIDFPEIVSNISFTADSTTSYNNDSAFWNNTRPVPLTAHEIKGYAQDTVSSDVEITIAGGKKKKNDDDSTRVRKVRKFKLTHLVMGQSYKIGKNTKFNIKSPLETAGFNTLEGFNFAYNVYFTRTFTNDNRLEIGPVARYAFAREKVVSKVYADLRHSDRKGNARLEGGRYVQQLNEEEPIHPHLNTPYTLLLKENYMKLYEKDFVRLNNEKQYSDAFSLRYSAEWAQRRSLENNSGYSLFKHEGKSYSPNDPANAELATTGFAQHNALLVGIAGDFKPWLKYQLKNGSKNIVRKSSPTFSLLYRKGISGLLSSNVNFDLIDVGVSHSFDWGIRGKVDVKVNAGKFINDRSMYFMDFKHFPGNQTHFTPLDPTKTYRLLDYYYYSTGNQYVTAFVHNQFRKLLLTQLRFARMKGIKENLFVNYLGTPASNHYTEVGYGLDYLFRVFRIEAIAAFENGRYKEFGVRVGIATNLEDLFDFN